MHVYSYPAVFIKEANGMYSVCFPDFEGCYTFGDDFADAIYMAQDRLGCEIRDLQAEGKALPKASELCDIILCDGETLRFVEYEDT